MGIGLKLMTRYRNDQSTKRRKLANPQKVTDCFSFSFFTDCQQRRENCINVFFSDDIVEAIFIFPRR